MRADSGDVYGSASALDPRGQVTTTSYQAFDTPATDAPMQIIAPDNSSTTFDRDDYGKPSSVTRSSNGG